MYNKSLLNTSTSTSTPTSPGEGAGESGARCERDAFVEI